jgi:hypothetical protein
MNGLEINTIILLFEEKIIGYLNYQIENYVSRKENASKKYIYIEAIEIHPEYKGKKFCNLLITKLIEFYKDDETINEYHLDKNIPNAHFEHNSVKKTNDVDDRTYILQPKINPGSYVENNISKPLTGRIQQIPILPENDKTRISKYITNNLNR